MSPSAVISPVQHLGAIAIVSPLVLAYAIAFIDPSNILERASIFLLSVAIAGQLQYSAPVFTGNSTYDGIFMSLVWVFHLHAFNLVLRKAVYLGEVTARKSAQSGLQRTYTAWCLLFNWRNINTPWTEKDPEPSRERPGYVPSNGVFVTRRVAYIILMYLALDAMFSFLPAPNVENDIPEHKEAISPRMGAVTLRIIARVFTAILSKILPAFSLYGMFTIPYNIASIIAVLWGGGEPKNWPQPLGSFLGGYSFRRYWRATWHRFLRSTLETHISYITTHVLFVPPTWEIFSRCVRLFLAFYVTALVHPPSAVVFGESAFALDVPKFFFMQAVGIVTDDTLLYAMAVAGGGATDNVTAKRTAKLWGYIWVIAWTAWTGPTSTWIIERKLVRGKDDVLPWSLVKWLGYGN
ncbi:hypothetical protein V502_04414 [Pseudogymnoascus sp. VKM F-4520 (FW-2644)]|nr:hypothetical protein V502_04414 [Pseudogymnoascus sp. VKM F-4520 (FW-2644)]